MLKDKLPGKMAEVLESALVELGLDVAYLLPYLDEVMSFRASTWIRACDALHLPSRFIVHGYNRVEHLERIAFDLDYGILDLPRTPRLKAMLRDIESLKGAKDHYETKTKI